MKNEQINENRVHQLEQEGQKDLEENEADEGKDLAYWKNLAKRLKKKLKSQIKDRKD